MTRAMRSGWLVIALGLAAVGCGDDDDDGGGAGREPIELVGEYTSSFGDDETITEETWGSAKIADYDNAENIAYVQSPADDEFTPNQYNVTWWTEPEDGAFYFCTVDFGLETLAEAKASEATADDSDPENGGCGGDFPWTKLTPKE